MSKRGREQAWGVEMGGAAVDTARVLMLLAQQYQHSAAVAPAAEPQVVVARGGHGHGHGRVFECKTCSRQFPTFQALGGHRASHKRPRLLPPPQQQHQHHELVGDEAALCLGRLPPPPLPPAVAAAKPRVHECPVCGLEFAIGQALGGHMRRHRSEADADADAPSSKAAPPAREKKACDVVGGICLDLNLTPSENCTKCRDVVGLGGAAGQAGVHKALAMLDCTL